MLFYFIILFHTLLFQTQLAELTRARVLSSTEVFFSWWRAGKKKLCVSSHMQAVLLLLSKEKKQEGGISDAPFLCSISRFAVVKFWFIWPVKGYGKQSSGGNQHLKLMITTLGVSCLLFLKWSNDKEKKKMQLMVQCTQYLISEPKNKHQ